MATLIRKEPFLTINGANLTAFVMDEGPPSHTTDVAPAQLPSGGRPDTYVTGYKKSGRFTCVLAQDFASGGPDATLKGVVGQTVAVVYRADKAVKSASNPEFSFNIFFNAYSPVNGATGRTSRVMIDAPISGPVTRDPA